MQKEIDDLYDAMMQAINAKRDQTNSADIAGSCFWIANKFWENLKKNIDKGMFECEGKEINFFRNIKPRFTSQIHFFTILAEVLMFVPEDPFDQIDFWRDELKRFKRFCQKNDEFVNYYEKNDVSLDGVFFKRVSSDWSTAQQPAFYDSDKNFCSSHDHLVRGYLAHKMYNDFVEEKLKELEI